MYNSASRPNKHQNVFWKVQKYRKSGASKWTWVFALLFDSFVSNHKSCHNMILKAYDEWFPFQFLSLSFSIVQYPMFITILWYIVDQEYHFFLFKNFILTDMFICLYRFYQNTMIAMTQLFRLFEGRNLCNGIS